MKRFKRPWHFAVTTMCVGILLAQAIAVGCTLFRMSSRSVAVNFVLDDGEVFRSVLWTSIGATSLGVGRQPNDLDHPDASPFVNAIDVPYYNNNERVQPRDVIIMSGWPFRSWVGRIGAQRDFRDDCSVVLERDQWWAVPVRPVAWPLVANSIIVCLFIGVARCCVATVVSRWRRCKGICIECGYPAPTQCSRCPECGALLEEYPDGRRD